MTDLLDASVLIPLCVSDHPHRKAALKWVAQTGRFEVCPITEGALVRYLYRVSHGDVEVVRATLEGLWRFQGCEFWPDNLSYLGIDCSRVRGHKQVTDAYLIALASAHGGRLATFDQGLTVVHPEAVLVPIN